MRSENEETTPFSCNYCGLSFKHVDHIIEHIKIHTNINEPEDIYVNDAAANSLVDFKSISQNPIKQIKNDEVVQNSESSEDTTSIQTQMINQARPHIWDLNPSTGPNSAKDNPNDTIALNSMIVHPGTTIPITLVNCQWT